MVALFRWKPVAARDARKHCRLAWLPTREKWLTFRFCVLCHRSWEIFCHFSFSFPISWNVIIFQLLELQNVLVEFKEVEFSHLFPFLLLQKQSIQLSFLCFTLLNSFASVSYFAINIAFYAFLFECKIDVHKPNIIEFFFSKRRANKLAFQRFFSRPAFTSSFQ